MRSFGKRMYGPAVLAVVLGVGACGGGSDGDTEASGTTQAEGAAKARDGAVEARTIEVELQDFAFAPAELSAPPGAQVTVKLRNTGAAPHSFTIPSLDVDAQVAAGESGEATFTMPDTGTVEFTCSFHESQGMKGTVAPA